jgi:hypothetical protein
MADEKEESRLVSPEPWLFTDKPDPTVVACAKVREVAETKRQAALHRARLLENLGVQWLIGGLGVAVLFSATLITHIIATRNRPNPPAVIVSRVDQNETSPAPPPCADSITRVNTSGSGTKWSCEPGQKFEMKPIDAEHALIVCTCSREVPSASEASKRLLEKPANPAVEPTSASMKKPPQDLTPDDPEFWFWETYWLNERGFCAQFDKDGVLANHVEGAPTRCLAWDWSPPPWNWETWKAGTWKAGIVDGGAK